MVRLIKFIHAKFIKSKKGQTAVEYALIVGGVALVLFLVVKNFRGPLDEGVKNVSKKIQSELEIE